MVIELLIAGKGEGHGALNLSDAIKALVIFISMK